MIARFPARTACLGEKTVGSAMFPQVSEESEVSRYLPPLMHSERKTAKDRSSIIARKHPTL